MQYYMDLHSNMVRFIINEYCLMIIDNVEIYIPIWLDLLFVLLFIVIPPFLDLHSNMVRFIMKICSCPR